ncbi:F-actin-monooxygenase MICAL2 isoform X6 [Monodelphis domestica]|uniref:F-actin-monooxygenase MICAL2 isoform X6 n=1 Tax=Monodelphis domestica TaxID=13616 RepID=UPI0024E23209|nr:F-actin-monooxygenase MICAL2 isoform X6 [Monodelphis domestica]
MGENEDEKQSQAGQIFENFVQASTCKGTLQAFNILIRHLQLDPSDHRNFYSKLKSKVTTWKAKALWNKLDKRGTHKEYKRGKSCMNTRCLVVGGGPCGLRTAIELAYLGAKVVVVEKRDTFSRNNVLHLWPFTIHDLRGLGAKKFYGKFCAGSIDHISIRQLQLILFKVALMLGVEIHVNIEFVKVLEPPEDQENQKVGWRAEILPADHSLSDFEFDVIIGADGRRNTLEGFRRKEFRGKLAIAITANFINRNTTAEAKVEEISGVAFIFNQKFFQDLKEETGIDLENIVYYKDSTHYFVMTAKKQSLLDKGVIVNDYIDTELLLGSENVNQDCLLSYAREAADFATNYQLPSLDFAMNHYGQPDVAMFDFTSMYASENAALVRERQSHQLLVALVGDSLLEPFWPMGTGCARGFLAAFDTAWMVKSWEQGIPPLEILAERESLYRLLPQTTPENISKNFEQYTLDPGTRYPNLNSNCVRPHQVKHLYITTELHHLPLERFGSIRRSVSLSRRESDIRPNKLLTWCQKQTEGYQHVSVTDLTTSWRSGLALCALIHRFRPELINFDSLNEEDAIENNQLAFDIAEREFGIPPMTTGKEMASSQEPDKLSLVMYLSKFYELFRGTPLRAVDSLGKNYGENGDLSLAKSSIFNNYLNLTFPRKRTPRVENLTEENDMNKRRRKGLDNLEEPSSFSSRSIGSSREYGISREGMNQNKVKSMANQLLAKFEENARNPSFLRQGSLRKEFPQNLGGSDICYFCKRRVYVMERLSAEGHFFHRECFRCEVCSTTLRLAAYAFDADEGKFYCKTHFIHCRTNSKQRKRRAELKRQEEEEAQEKQQEVKWSDPSPEILGPAVNSREASPPADFLLSADEPTSPKKPKSISGPCDADGQRGLFPAEWTSVKIGPKGEGNEDDVLAICVMVTSDGSSSETESDSGDNSSQMQFSEQKTLKSQQLPCPKPFRRQVSLTVPQNRRPGTGCPEESKVANALHRAHSFQHPTSNKYQNGRRKCQSNLTSPNSKKSVLSSKDPPYSSSAPGPGKPSGDVPLPQATYTTSPEIKRRHSQPQSPIIQGRVRMREVCKEIPLYIPHRFQKEDSSSTHGPGDVGMKLANGHWKTKTIPWKTGNTRDGPDHVGVEPRSRPSLSLTSEKSQGNTTIGSKTEENELKSNEGRKQCLKKLALTQEQKSQLLDWNDANAENLSLDTGELMHAGNERGETSKLSNLSSFPGPAKEALSHQRETPQESCGPTPRATREGAVNRPKSPLRLIANAIRKSLEPLLSNPEGGKKNSDSRPKTLMENLSLNGPQPCDQSPNLKKTSYSKNCDVQKPTLSSLLVPGNERGTSDSAISLHVAPEAQPVTRGLSDRVARARSLPSRQKRSMTLPSAIVEDSSTLLDKVNLKEVLLGKSLDQYKALTKKGSLFSSFRLKEKTYESLGSMKTRKDLGSIFSNPGAKDICYTPKKPSEPWNKSSSGQMDILLPGENLSSMHLPVRAQMTECYSSFSSSDTTSSSDGEFEPQPSLPPKERRTLKRIRKMEKASKQLAKQEEFKRLYKAQAIQRQLEEVEERQRASEIQGVELEKALRGESDSGAQDEARLLHEWFKLVLEKNKLMRYESELLIMAQELELEDHQSRLEQKLREKMCMEESEKDDSIRNEEQEIFTKMMRVIEQRDRLVDSLEEQRVKEKAEDQHFENFMLSRAYQLSRS